MGHARGRQFWEPLIAEVERGASISSVAARHEVASSGLGYWVRRYRQERRSTALLPVRVAEDGGRRVAIEVDGLRLVFRDAEADYVAAVARAIRSR